MRGGDCAGIYKAEGRTTQRSVSRLVSDGAKEEVMKVKVKVEMKVNVKEKGGRALAFLSCARHRA